MRHVPPFGNVPVLGQQQRQAQAGIMQAVHGLAIGIYSRLAVEYINLEGANTDHLHQLAKHSLQAAQAYFEALGVAQFDNTPEKPNP